MTGYYIRNLYERVSSVLNEDIAEEAAKLTGSLEDEVREIVKDLPFNKYLELGNAVETDDAEAAREILGLEAERDLENRDFGDEDFLDDEPYEGHGEEDELEEDIVEFPNKKIARDFKPGSRVRNISCDSAPRRIGTVAEVAVPAGDGKPALYYVKFPFSLRNYYIYGNDLEPVSESIEEADNPYQKVVPPSQEMPSKSLAQSQRGAQPTGNNASTTPDVQDLQPGDQIQVKDLTGKTVSVKVRQPNSPNDTIVVQGQEGQDHVIKKSDVVSIQSQQTNESEEKKYTCPECHGRKMVRRPYMGEMEWDTCPTCDGEGRILPKQDPFRAFSKGLGEELERMQKLAGVPMNEDQSKMYDHKNEWLRDAERKGYLVEPSGDDKLIAHQDGIEKGVWDPRYGGFGMGIFFESTLKEGLADVKNLRVGQDNDGKWYVYRMPSKLKMSKGYDSREEAESKYTSFARGKYGVNETASAGATGAGSVATAPTAFQTMISRNASIYGNTKAERPAPKKRKKNPEANTRSKKS